MSPAYELSTDRNGRRFRRVMAWSLVASVAVHAGLLLAWRGAPDRAAGPGASGAPARSPRPTDALRVVRLRTDASARQAAIPEPPPPIETAAARPVPVDVPEGEVGLDVRLERPPGAGSPGGDEAGAGSGSGGEARLVPPEPRSVYPEWDPPASVRGTTVTVRVRVDSTGCPVGAVRLDPPTADDGFNRQLRNRVRRMRFRPASLAGRPVEAWAELTFRF